MPPAGALLVLASAVAAVDARARRAVAPKALPELSGAHEDILRSFSVPSETNGSLSLPAVAGQRVDDSLAARAVAAPAPKAKGAALRPSRLDAVAAWPARDADPNVELRRLANRNRTWTGSLTMSVGASAGAAAAAEYINAARQRYATPAQAFQSMETNKDGQVSPAEWNDEGQKLNIGVVEHWKGLQDMDTDGDNALSEKEFFTAVGKDTDMSQWKESAPTTTTPVGDTEAVDRDFVHDSNQAPKRSGSGWPGGHRGHAARHYRGSGSAAARRSVAVALALVGALA